MKLNAIGNVVRWVKVQQIVTFAAALMYPRGKSDA